MAQKDQRLIFERAPVRRPDRRARASCTRFRSCCREIAAGSGPRMEVSLDRDGGQPRARSSAASRATIRCATSRCGPSPYQAFVRIMIGCDKFCTYCIVPKVRGPEQSRPAAQIVAEARRLADEGCREITLLGQTVNSYRHTAGGRTSRLSDLLVRLHDIPGIDRIKFVTNYPKDMTDDLLQAVRDLPKCSHYLHVPAQSGSNAVLQRMKRGYTVEDYREMLARIRETIPDAAVTSDFIVGFCGETEEEFAASGRAAARRPIQEQLHFQVQPAAGHQERRTVRRRRAGRGQAPPQQRAVGPANRDQRRRQPGISGRRGRSAGRRAEQNRTESRGRRPTVVQLTGRTQLRSNRGVRRATAG